MDPSYKPRLPKSKHGLVKRGLTLTIILPLVLGVILKDFSVIDL